MCKLNHKVIVIAEAGVNHNGKLSYAKKLVDKAKHCGADYIKFQTFNPDLISTPKGDVAPYQKKILKGIKNQKKMLKSLSLNYKEFETLIKYCKKKKLNF